MKTNELFTTYPKLNLKRVCDTLGVCYQYALKLSKTPVKDQAYDPSAINYTELDKMLDRKGIKLEDTDWSAIEQDITVREPAIPLEKFQVGTSFQARNISEATIVYINIWETRDIYEIAFVDHNTGKMRVMSADTFLHQSPRIIQKV